MFSPATGIGMAKVKRRLKSLNFIGFVRAAIDSSALLTSSKETIHLVLRDHAGAHKSPSAHKHLDHKIGPAS